ncbi:MAG: biopolymer transporter ExbD [Bacteroidia bacterium]
MAIKKRSRVRAEFSMASLTDIIFLLLIFFMLTSSFVTPNALKLLLPKATGTTMTPQNVTVNITPDLEYIIDNEKVPLESLKNKMRQDLAAIPAPAEPAIVVNADKSVPIDYVVKVMVMANELNAKVILATEPE